MGKLCELGVWVGVSAGYHQPPNRHITNLFFPTAGILYRICLVNRTFILRNEQPDYLCCLCYCVPIKQLIQKIPFMIDERKQLTDLITRLVAELNNPNHYMQWKERQYKERERDQAITQLKTIDNKLKIEYHG